MLYNNPFVIFRIVYICMLYHPCERYNAFIITEPEGVVRGLGDCKCVISLTGVAKKQLLSYGFLVINYLIYGCGHTSAPQALYNNPFMIFCVVYIIMYVCYTTPVRDITHL